MALQRAISHIRVWIIIRCWASRPDLHSVNIDYMNREGKDHKQQVISACIGIHSTNTDPASFLCKWLQIEKPINRCYSLQIVLVSAWQLWLTLLDKWKENHSQQLFSSKSLINYILMNLKQLLWEPSEVYQKWRIALCKS